MAKSIITQDGIIVNYSNLLAVFVDDELDDDENVLGYNLVGVTSMKELNISAVGTTAATETTATAQPKHKWLSKFTRGAKKATMFATIAGVMAMTCTTQAFAAGTGVVDTSSFITTASTVLKSVICLIGGGVSLWGVVNLLEGYGNDNPGAKAQ